MPSVSLVSSELYHNDVATVEAPDRDISSEVPLTVQESIEVEKEVKSQPAVLEGAIDSYVNSQMKTSKSTYSKSWPPISGLTEGQALDNIKDMLWGSCDCLGKVIYVLLGSCLWPPAVNATDYPAEVDLPCPAWAVSQVRSFNGNRLKPCPGCLDA